MAVLFAVRYLHLEQLIILAVGLVAIARCSFENSVPVQISSHDTIVLGAVTNPLVIDLGNFSTGLIQSRRIKLYNSTKDLIRLDGFKTSCECVSVVGLPVDISNGALKEVVFKINSAGEAGFTGELGITVELLSGKEVQGTAEVRCSIGE